MQCTNCCGTDFSSEAGAYICNACGVVAEENNIVSEVSFIEGAGGGSSVVGQFVSATGSKSFRGVPGLAKESREQTIENGRRRIAQVAGTLKLSQHHIEAAQRLFMLAVQHNFIQGRKTQNVVAACLYIVCRREKTPHMLIDFSDVLQTNVYVLGHTFLRFCRLLSLQLPLIDPSLYIQRFAARMEFDDKAHQVANTALRIVSRMRRDWLQTGRRPAGICGAGLLIAARLHGFRRTQRDVLQVVRVCNVTLQKRLNEFEETPSGFLTPQEFETVDLEDEADPPAFTRLRQKEEQQAQRLLEQQQQEQQQQQLEQEAAPDAQPTSAAGTPQAATADEGDEGDLEREMEAALDSREARAAEQDLAQTLLPSDAPTPPTPAAASAAAAGRDSAHRPPPASHHHQQQQQQQPASRTYSTAPPIVLPSSSGARRDAAAGGEESLSDIDDDEISVYLNTETEAKAKDAIWTELNRDWLKRQAERLKLEQAKAAGGSAAGVKRKHAGGRRGGGASSGAMPPAENAAEAAAEMLRRRVSSKINYAALEGLFSIDDQLLRPPSAALGRKVGSGPQAAPAYAQSNRASMAGGYAASAETFEHDDYDDYE
eukprot:TRINITY_DN2221_c2_g2_i1.p1 TRINITY_DN2221_c2_g2~~TRINITY_DN2221_c2_g2_i1.p1  ORF type:complete len:599 (+),score=216.18 TRINITY_DN2221_c2_g2_i1:112-1908(+)